MKIEPNKYQKAIFEFVQNGSGNGIIEAVAGSGKTWTIVEATKFIKPGERAIFVAFNRAICDALKSKLPNTVRAATLHSVGYSIIRENTIRPIEMNEYKLADLMKLLIDERIPNYEKNFTFIRNIIPKIKATLCPVDLDNLLDLAFEYNLDEDLVHQTNIERIRLILNACKKHPTIDFDDMIWLPIVKNQKSSKTYDWVFVDEVQDLNKSQFELVKKICNSNTRIIAVGDSRQSIYGFRGADSESMNNFREYFKAREFPLSICYRCPKSVIELAQTIVPQIEAPRTASPGIVRETNIVESIKEMNDGDLVLCRTNAPLVDVAFALIRQHKKAVIRGSDIGKNLVKLIDKYQVKTLEELTRQILKSRNLQTTNLAVAREERDHRHTSRYRRLIDTYNTFLAITENATSIENLRTVIANIFSDDKVGVICSSVHKAKGLEYDKVFILYYDTLMPHPMAKTSKEEEQEYNIKYVAITRAKKELNLILGEYEQER